MLRISLIIFFLQNFIVLTFAQSSLERTTNSFGRAAAESFSLTDLPGGLLWISSRYYPIQFDNKFKVSQFGIDRALQDQFYIPGSKSLGGMNPHYYPESVFLGRMVLTTAAGLFFGVDTYESYKHGIIFYKAVMYNHALTELVKNLTHRDRPDHSDNRSFFSGHTSLAFVTSSFLYLETNSFISDNFQDPVLRTSLKAASFAALYGWAGYVGYSRLRDNKHYLSDILTGAAVGTFIGVYFHNLYFGSEVSFLEYISFGVDGDQPVVNFSYKF
jgi:membrane-associated phospholipid phosphatase